MHYLAGTMDYRIHYSSYHVVLEGYNDASWISNVDELYATSGYVFTLSGAAVSWWSWRQNSQHLIQPQWKPTSFVSS
jgi:hypothetical protein